MKRKVEFSGKEIEYTLNLKNRKSISIKIKDDGIVYVSAPIGIDYDVIDNIVKKKWSWILKAINKITSYKFINDEKVLLLGKYYNLIVKKSIRDSIYIENDNVIVNSPFIEDIYIRKILVQWYKKISLDIIEQRVMMCAEKTLLNPSKIIIRDQKSIWGSCNSKKEIRLNWRLVLMPYFVIDYIIIHELCHIIHMNHSKDFWDLVNRYCPNYKESKNWLKENGAMLMNLV